MYTSVNFKTKREFKEAVKMGKQIVLFSPGIGEPRKNGREFVEGPHYPEPHRWYAEVQVKNGVVVSVK